MLSPVINCVISIIELCSFSYIMDTSPLLVGCFANIFSHSVGHLFTYLMVSFAALTFYLFFFFCVCAFGSYLRRLCLTQSHEDLFLYLLL